ncbi:hypothetical protein IW262DRAFT_1301310 [Armillaria fumosa]|nr:hypothetical protein IW262DRAFT_1301310 [Armillaria fumosa]
MVTRIEEQLPSGDKCQPQLLNWYSPLLVLSQAWISHLSPEKPRCGGVEFKQIVTNLKDVHARGKREFCQGQLLDWMLTQVHGFNTIELSSRILCKLAGDKLEHIEDNKVKYYQGVAEGEKKRYVKIKLQNQPWIISMASTGALWLERKKKTLDVQGVRELACTEDSCGWCGSWDRHLLCQLRWSSSGLGTVACLWAAKMVGVRIQQPCHGKWAK